MPNTIVKSLGLVTLAALCATPLTASQQDDASNRRKNPAPVATAAGAKAATPARPAAAVAPAEQVAVRKYQITASEGRILPGHIRAKRGELIRITFVSRDDTYGIRFKDFGVKEKLTPEKPVVIELRPDKAGTFEFRCTRVWGVSHWSNNGAMEVD